MKIILHKSDLIEGCEETPIEELAFCHFVYTGAVYHIADVVIYQDGPQEKVLKNRTGGQGATFLVLAKRHTGMRVEIENGITRAMRHARAYPGCKFMAGEFFRHLNEMATRYYSGDVTVVDEFLQLYCFDEKRPKTDDLQAPLSAQQQDLPGGVTS